MSKPNPFSYFQQMNADRIVSISAIVVSLGTLFLIMYQTNLIRKEQKASVMPNLSIGYGIHIENDEIEESIRLSNLGVGPAFVREVRVIEGDEVFETDPVGYLLDQDIYNRRKSTTVNRLLPGAVIPANNNFEIYGQVLDSTSTISLQETFRFPSVLVEQLFDVPQSEDEQNHRQATIEIVYENVYGDRWVARSDRHAPVALD